MIKIIACIDSKRGIGKDNQLLYKLPRDMKRFKALTEGHIVVMGYNTFKSLNFKPLPNRDNIVIYNEAKPLSCTVANVECYEYSTAVNIIKAKQALLKLQNIKQDIWIIGGQSVYELFVKHVDELHITEVEDIKSADRFFPDPIEYLQPIDNFEVIEDFAIDGEYMTNYIVIRRITCKLMT